VKRCYQVLQEPALEADVKLGRNLVKEANEQTALYNRCAMQNSTEDGIKIRGFVKTLARAMADTAAWKFSAERSTSQSIVEGTVNGAEVTATFFMDMACLYVDGVQIRLRESEQRKLGKEVCKLRRRMRRTPEKIAIAKLEAKPTAPPEAATGEA
jgi:hypothetical protein